MEPGPDATRVTVTAHSLLRDLLLQADRLHPEARVDRGLVTLLPGESAVFAVTGWPAPAAGALPAALRCVNAVAATGAGRAERGGSQAHWGVAAR